MAKSETEVKVRLIDVEGIHGLIESMTEVADRATQLVDVYESGVDNDIALDSPMARLRDALIALNNYVDEHLHDE